MKNLLTISPILLSIALLSMREDRPEWIYMKHPLPTRIVVNANNAGNSVYVTDGMATYDPNPGDTIYFASTKGSVNIKNLKGTSSAHLIITAASGIVIGGNTGGENFSFAELEYVDFHDIHLRANPANTAKCMYVGNYKHVGIYDVKGVNGADGLQVKTDVSSGHFWPYEMNEDLRIERCRFDSSAAEGFYIHHTFSPPPVDIYHLPPPGIGLVMINDSSLVSGWDGIQVADVQNCYLRGNYVKKYGQEGTAGQWSGVITGAGSTFIGIYDTYVSNGPGPGFNAFNHGITYIHNMILDSVARETDGEGGIYCSNKYAYKQALQPQKLIFDSIAFTGTGSTLVPPFRNLDGAPSPDTYRSDSGWAYNVTYPTDKWTVPNDWGKTRPINGTDGVPTQLYKYIINRNLSRQKIKT